ncbi:MAG: hypothetical protein CMJ70_06575 [Planctomycetaceae bacterium]|nr:hypothetical protein [Planctomycetaceae bacterium]
MHSNLKMIFLAGLTVYLTLSAATGQEPAELVVTKLDSEQPTRILLRNRFLELTFDPARGGRCSRLLVRRTGEQVIGDDDVSGMFLDHWAKYAWPSGLMHLPYKYEMVKEGAKRAGVRLWVQVPKFGGGQGTRDRTGSLQMATSPDLVGLTVRKTIWVNSDNDTIQVDQELVNTTTQSRAAALYIQQNLCMSGSHYSDNWYLPSTSGVRVNLQPEKRGGRAIGPDWIQTPVAGWMAVKDRKTQHGMVFAFDYNYLRKTYTSGATGEWFFEPVPLGPGKSFRTTYVVKPVSGFKDFVYGSSALVADIQADEVGQGQVKITHEVMAVGPDQNEVAVELQVVGWKSKKLLAAKVFQVPRLSSKRLQQQLVFKPAALADGLLISAIVRTGTKEERYERFYAGDRAELQARTNLFATEGGGLPSGRGDRYFRPQPIKRKQFDKPDFTKISPRDPQRFRCLVVFGLYTHILNLDDAVDGWKHHDVDTPVEFTWANCPPNGVETFPGTYDELFQYDLVVLSDVNYRALGDVAMEMVCDYVEQGGSLFVVGGPYAFGNGEFQGSRFLDVLPVRLRGPFDLKWAGKGKSWKLVREQPEHPLLKGVEFDQVPHVFWHHFVTPKPNASVVLKAGPEPTLILGRYGEGRVATLTLSPTGLAGKGEVAWWDWKGWFPLVRNLFGWSKEGRQ